MLWASIVGSCMLGPTTCSPAALVQQLPFAIPIPSLPFCVSLASLSFLLNGHVAFSLAIVSLVSLV